MSGKTKLGKRELRIRRDVTFGSYFWAEELNNWDLVVVCSNNGGGYVPVSVRLPHQVYVEEFGKLQGLALLPLKSGNEFTRRERGPQLRGKVL